MADKIDVGPYVNEAISRANDYVKKYGDTEKLAGKDAKETAEIKAFLKTNPYDTDKIRGVVKDMLRELIKDAKPAADGKRQAVYLSGPIGSKHLLMEATEDRKNTSAPIEELRALLKGSVKSDFRELKENFTKFSKQPVEPYGKWRGLLSGMDQAGSELARKENFNVVMDNTLAPLDEAARKYVSADIAKDRKSGKVTVFAVALTPEQASAEARKRELPEKEAANTARNFHDFFEQIKKDVPNITLLDKNMNVIYQQKDGKETKHDKIKMKAWDMAFEQGAAGQGLVDLGSIAPNVKGLPKPPRQLGE